MNDRFITITFFGTCSASSEETLVSKIIGIPFVTVEFNASFALGTDREMELYFYAAADDHDPSSGKPSGINLLDTLGQVSYITGDDESKRLLHSVDFPDPPTFLKLYAINNDTFDHTIDANIIIKPLV